MRKLILTTTTALMVSTSAFAGTVSCDPAQQYHPMVTDGNGKTYQASYFNNPSCAIGETERRREKLGFIPEDEDEDDLAMK